MTSPTNSQEPASLQPAATTTTKVGSKQPASNAEITTSPAKSKENGQPPSQLKDSELALLKDQLAEMKEQLKREQANFDAQKTQLTSQLKAKDEKIQHLKDTFYDGLVEHIKAYCSTQNLIPLDCQDEFSEILQQLVTQSASHFEADNAASKCQDLENEVQIHLAETNKLREELELSRSAVTDLKTALSASQNTILNHVSETSLLKAQIEEMEKASQNLKHQFLEQSAQQSNEEEQQQEQHRQNEALLAEISQFHQFVDQLISGQSEPGQEQWQNAILAETAKNLQNAWKSAQGQICDVSKHAAQLQEYN